MCVFVCVCDILNIVKISNSKLENKVNKIRSLLAMRKYSGSQNSFNFVQQWVNDNKDPHEIFLQNELVSYPAVEKESG